MPAGPIAPLTSRSIIPLQGSGGVALRTLALVAVALAVFAVPSAAQSLEGAAASAEKALAGAKASLELKAFTPKPRLVLSQEPPDETGPGQYRPCANRPLVYINRDREIYKDGV